MISRRKLAPVLIAVGVVATVGAVIALRSGGSGEVRVLTQGLETDFPLPVPARVLPGLAVVDNKVVVIAGRDPKTF